MMIKGLTTPYYLMNGSKPLTNSRLFVFISMPYPYVPNAMDGTVNCGV
ncbi:hypothetical protein ES319_D10G065900v1 [Gossypium barbadense]|uniref:Uncharacterized protein n=3 Tax=Gossypium TaxID=3633 RepID=A0A5J5PND7_GOSBA|nr:hypothetical protein ES319_D10G065900v1 [Gossypium barbadense]TYG49107.1 hypothetical protein ES288_D10G068400v1 [Gossypium darwinii]TYH48487.1 hypothetical protein ES332_D10G070100v1 [Gossypium tomentosum]